MAHATVQKAQVVISSFYSLIEIIVTKQCVSNKLGAKTQQIGGNHGNQNQ